MAEATVVIDVERTERYWYPDSGGEVWVSGYQLVDPDSGRFLARDTPELAARGLRIAAAAGAGVHHTAVLESDVAAPGRALTLRRDPSNEHDPNAIAVLTEGEQLGWVPRELAAELAPALDEGEEWSAVVLREQRRTPRDPRHGVTLLLGRAAAIELREHGAR